VHYGNDPDAAIREAKHAAGDKNVLVHGASTAQRAVASSLLDELEIHLIPVLLGGGLRGMQPSGSSSARVGRSTVDRTRRAA